MNSVQRSCAGATLALFIVCVQAQAAAAPYATIEILQPANGQTVFNNNGDVEVRVAVEPPLRSASGDKIALFVDGTAATTQLGTDAQASGRFSLTGIERGTHTLEARIVDGAGNTVMASAPVSFYLWHASRLFPNRRH